MFNDVTAAMFKEWHVIKKNKYGKKQQRMLGIDLNKIYNRKVGERVITSSKSTKIVRAAAITLSRGNVCSYGIYPSLWRVRRKDPCPVWSGCASTRTHPSSRSTSRTVSRKS
jgi:hypothetical protein